MMAEKTITDNFNGEVAKKRKITDHFKPRDSPQTEKKQSSEIQSSIDAINNDTAKLGVELGRIQQKQESLMMDKRSVTDSQLKFESKNLQVSTDLVSLGTKTKMTIVKSE